MPKNESPRNFLHRLTSSLNNITLTLFIFRYKQFDEVQTVFFL